MHFNKHSNLEGKHAVLTPSTPRWVNYDNEKLINYYNTYQACQRGTELHEFAKKAIEFGINLPRTKKTLCMYVNDAIGFKMQPEQVLYYSDNCFGTADTISFRNNILRIHDLKTGIKPASMKQLEIYAALFCLEYNKKPEVLTIELRIYQSNEIVVERPTPEMIREVMNKIVQSDKLLESMITKEI